MIDIPMSTEFYKLAQRANINHYTISTDYGVEKDVLIYDDHRTLLNILFEIQKNKWIDGIPNLFYFDQHDDAVVPRGLSIEDRLAKFDNREICDIDSKEFWAYTEFELSILDDDWLTAAFDFNLINDAVCIGVKKNDNIQFTNERYVDAEVKHRLISIDHLGWEIGNRGLLADDFIQDETSLYLRSLFHHNTNEPNKKPFILDFDLDCFSTDCLDYTIAWPEKLFREKYVTNYKVNHLMNSLIARSSLITICREPGCCGGIGESNKILSYLDYYFFDGGLRAQPID